MGFHGLKELLTTTSYLTQHCEFLTPNVGIVAQITRAVAALFLRSGKKLAYLNLHRPDEVNLDGLTNLEDKYERAMFKKWSREDGSPDCGWHRFIEYQVPVFDRRSSPTGLRALDLLAISQSGFPVVVELKVLSLGVTVHESRVSGVQTGTEPQRCGPGPSVEETDAPNITRQTRVGVSDRSTLLTTWCAPASECPCQARSWGWEVSGVATYLRREPAHDINPTAACRTQYSSAINGTDSSAMLPKSGAAATCFGSVRGGFTGQQNIA
jgi:hypothetical protein